VPGVDQYSVWATDSSGNYISNNGTVSGTSSALESFEPVFHQDLNGDGSIGATSQLVQAMAGFGGSSGAPDSLNPVPVAADTSQTTFLTTPHA